jgi:hypothetical protein
VANCARVLHHALIAAGLWEDRLADAFHGHQTQACDIVDLWYSTLIQMTQREPESERLLDSAGNLVTPAAPHFTACWPTAVGLAAAQRLLTESLDWKQRLTL